MSLKPIVKWAGGKQEEIKYIEKYIPSNYNTYIEPFIGGGALFFHLNPKKAVINDIHKDLIDFYTAIKNGKSMDIYNYMTINKNEEETYYKIRADDDKTDYLDNAKRFYYLRKTCYRGLSRYNKKGKFNVSYGFYKKCNFEVLKNNDYEKLFSNTIIHNKSFEYIFENYNDEENFLFLDPPYDNQFTNYGFSTFGKEEHEKLAKYFKTTKIKCLLIIGKTDFIENLYKDYIVDQYHKNYKIKIHSKRINDEINNIHLVIKNY